MCKLAYISNMSKMSIKQKKSIFKAINESMSSERSGYGVASRSLKHNKIEIFKTLNIKDGIDCNNTDLYPDFVIKTSQGSIDIDNANEVIFHGRTSTNTVSLKNTHPFVNKNVTLCHNGVVQYHGQPYNKKTDNDTEDLTHCFTQGGINQVSSDLTGYAAFIAFQDKKTIIARDSIASLHYCYISKYNAHIVATTETTIKSILKCLKIDSVSILKIKDNTIIEIENNKIISFNTWSGLSRSAYADSKKHLSLASSYPENSLYDISHFTKSELNIIQTELESGLIDVYLDGDKLTAREFSELDQKEKSRCYIYDKLA